jgi:uncharacterized protein YjbJ (UPF0337 family)
MCALPPRSSSPGHSTTTNANPERTMNEDTVKGDLTQLKGRMRVKWGKLTDDDLEQIAGNKDVLVGKIQERYGHAKEQAGKDVDAFYNELTPMAT